MAEAVLVPVESVPDSLKPLYDGDRVKTVWKDADGIHIIGSLGSEWFHNWKGWEEAVALAEQDIRVKKLTEIPDRDERWTYNEISFAAAMHEREKIIHAVEELARMKEEGYAEYRKASEARRANPIVKEIVEALDDLPTADADGLIDEAFVHRKKPMTTSITLWPHQDRAVPNVFDLVRQGKRRILLVGPTGMGKMVLAAWFMAKTASQGKRSLFLADIRELIGQCQDTLHRYGVEAGVIMAMADKYSDDFAQVASKDSLWRRAFTSDRITPPEANLLIADEAHKSRADTWQGILNHYKDSVLLGFTATPCRQDGKGLGSIYDAMVIVATYKELREAGVIVPSRVYAPTIPDLKGVRFQSGDYVRDELAKRMDKSKLVGDIVKDWRKRADGRLSVVFASGVAHSIHIRNQFLRHGIAAEHIDSKNTSWAEREDILGKLHDGEVTVVCNYGVLTTGWDEPAVSCMVCARPTRSLALWRQMAGRVLRSCPGKTDAIILDHSGAVFRHGYPDEDIEWELGEDRNIHDKIKEKLKKEAAEQKEPYRCPREDCAMMYRGPECPGCGYKPTPKERAVAMTKGELKEVTREQLRRNHGLDQKQKAWNDCLGWAIGTNQKVGAAAHRYKQIYGCWPDSSLTRVPRGKKQWNQTAKEFYEAVVDYEKLGVEMPDEA
jgi:DNA repair protein RadD